MIGIYKITNLINNKMYIGQSTNIERRLQEHRYRKGDQYIHNAIKKYGVNNFLFEVLEECSLDELNDRERYWINYYHTYTKDPLCNGYNETPGGDSGKGLGRSIKQYDCNGNLINIFNSVQSAANSVNGSTSHISGCCNHKRKTAYGYQWRYSEDILPLQQVVPHGREVNQIQNNTIIHTFPSVTQAAQAVNGNNSNISRACKTGIMAFGYYWQYA